MRKLSKCELGLLIGVVIATGVAHGDESLPEIVIQGYQDVPVAWWSDFAESSPETPGGGSGPGGAYSANPSAHVNCSVHKLASAINSNGKIGPANPAPQPNNTSLPIPIRYDNPIDIVGSSSICSRYGGYTGSTGFCVFSSLADGVYAANYSSGNYAAAGYTITGLINAWAPPAQNPNAMSNTLSLLGITANMASSTLLTQLTATQATQVNAAFAWQEGYQPSGC
jgi:hypothetical protein